MLKCVNKNNEICDLAILPSPNSNKQIQKNRDNHLPQRLLKEWNVGIEKRKNTNKQREICGLKLMNDSFTKIKQDKIHMKK